MEESKKIGEEFGLASEAEAVEEYSLLDKEVLKASKLIVEKFNKPLVQIKFQK